MPAPHPDELNDFIDDALADKLRANRRRASKNRRRNLFVMGAMVFVFLPLSCFLTFTFGVDDTGETLELLRAASVPILLTLAFALVYVPVRLWIVNKPIPFDYADDIVAPLIQFIDPRLQHRAELGLEDDVLPPAIASHICSSPNADHRFQGRVGGAQTRLIRLSCPPPLWRRPFGPRRPDDLGLLLIVDAHQDPEISISNRGDDAIADLRRTLGATFDLPGTPYIHTEGARLNLLAWGVDPMDRDLPIHDTDTSHLHQTGRLVSALITIAESWAQGPSGD